MISLTINKHTAEQRLDRYLRKTFPSVSLGLLFSIIRKKKVRINGHIGKSAQILKENDKIDIYENLQENNSAFVGANPRGRPSVNLDIVYQNADFVVINKPSGLASQSGTGVKEEDCLVGMLDAWAAECGFDFKPALVHRLDKETSGLIIAATTGAAVREFAKIIRERKIKKEYFALVKGNLKGSGKISEPLKGAPKIATTFWKVEEAYNDCTLLRVNIETGYKHQIRIHFAQKGHPLLGDTRHGDFAFNREFKKKYGLNRLFLHATLLEFYWQGKKIMLEQPLPEQLCLNLK